MTRSVCLLDWDGTLREGYVIFDWTQYLARKGVVHERFVESMKTSFDKFKARSINYEQMADCIVRAYASSQEGLQASEVERFAVAFVESNPDVFPFAAPLIEHLWQKEIEPIIITGSPTIVVKHFAEKIGVRRCHGLELKIDHRGAFDGSYEFNLAIEINKRILVEQLEAESRDIRLALGNSGSDVPLLEVARCGYFITDSPGTASPASQLDVLIRQGRLREISPEKLLLLVEGDKVLWR